MHRCGERVKNPYVNWKFSRENVGSQSVTGLLKLRGREALGAESPCSAFLSDEYVCT